jgi:tetratricopeptide (TPR) repeat protein
LTPGGILCALIFRRGEILELSLKEAAVKKILNRVAVALALMVCLAAIAAAQGTGRLDGEVLDADGKPFPDVVITLKNKDTGQTLTAKTDKAGKFSVLGLRTAIYNVSLSEEKTKLTYQDQVQTQEQGENHKSWNFKELIAQQKAANPEAEKAKEEEAKKFEGLKAHFTAGVAAMTDAKAVKAQSQAAPTDQSLKDKLSADYQTAITEFKAAEQAALPKDVTNHALVWANLGAAEEATGDYADAITSFDKANALKPQASYYVAEATDTAKAGKAADAAPLCEKAATMDPTVATMCWKNLGIVLTNTGNMKEAIPALQKATTADPKDAQGWYLLGNSLAATIETKQEGEKMDYIIPPGTTDAYQKCIDANASGPYAAQCKAALEGIQQLAGGVDTTVGKRAKKKGTSN